MFEMVSSMLKKAFVRLSLNDKPILDSDQKWQYQMLGYRRLLAPDHLTEHVTQSQLLGLRGYGKFLQNTRI